MRATSVLEDLWRDLTHATRVLGRDPGFTAVAVLTLALGIGATAAMFSVVYGVLLKPLPFPEPERLVSVLHRAPGINVPLLLQGPATFFTYRENGRVFEDLGLWRARTVSVTGHGEPELVQALQVTDGLLPVLRVQPMLGRTFTRDDDAPGRPLRMILTYGYWLRRFGRATNVLGQSMTVDGRPHEVIGVLPRSFQFVSAEPAVLLPIQLNPATAVVGADLSYQSIARLKPNVTPEQASADVARMIPLMFEQFPLPPGATRNAFDKAQLGPNVHLLSQDVIGEADRVLWILFVTVGIVLLIACVNVANLFLVRIEKRQQEFAIRSALGASRGRVTLELLAESVNLALAGGTLGLVFAFAATRVLATVAPAGLPRIDEIGLNLVVILFAVVISVVTGVLLGLIPIRSLGTSNIAALKEGGRSASGAPGRHRVRNVLVISEVALAVVLLVMSGLMIRTFIALRQVNPGFVRPQQVLTFRLSIPGAPVQSPEQVVQTFEQIAQHLENVTGVVSVSVSSSVTMDGITSNSSLSVEDSPKTDGGPTPLRRHKWIADGYFKTMGNTLVAGRAITWADSYQRRSVAMISERLARDYWKDPAQAIGKRIKASVGPWREIIGVARDERDDGLNQPAPGIVYWPMLMSQFTREPVSVQRSMVYAVRSKLACTPGFLRQIQQAVWSVNPNLPLARVRTLDEISATSMARTSFATVMLAVAASVALLFGVVGIYGVIAYVVTQRTREIGIRIALGAQIGDVRRLFLHRGLLLISAGIILGIVVALSLTRVTSALLFGVSPVDPATYAAVSIGLAGVAVLATWLPTRRASRVDPVVALRAGM
jgi:predicted permease